jgi:hypothetical protein
MYYCRVGDFSFLSAQTHTHTLIYCECIKINNSVMEIDIQKIEKYHFHSYSLSVLFATRLNEHHRKQLSSALHELK